MIKVGVAGYGVIGQRLADSVAMQDDMTLVGVANVTPSLSVRALKERGMPYNLYLIDREKKSQFDALNIPISGDITDLLSNVDVILDAAPIGVGIKNKPLYKKIGVKAIFQGGEPNSVADVLFHSHVNYEKGLDIDYLKIPSCNTTGLIRAVDCLDRKYGIERITITIIRRIADPGDYHRGLTNALQLEKSPPHQAIDFMIAMPHIEATGILVHTPVTHGHMITVLAHSKKGKISKEMALKAFKAYNRIRTVRIDEGFLGNASLFRYARDLGNPRGDMYEIALWEDSIIESGNDIMFVINIPQESVTIPETLDAIRACTNMQPDSKSATAITNKYLKIPNNERFK
jgi:glyceraldehyde-3-phosphate dehydrogenase (NAD(P))